MQCSVAYHKGMYQARTDAGFGMIIPQQRQQRQAVSRDRLATSFFLAILYKHLLGTCRLAETEQLVLRCMLFWA